MDPGKSPCKFIGNGIMGLILVLCKYIQLTPEPAGHYPWTSACLPACISASRLVLLLFQAPVLPVNNTSVYPLHFWG